MTKGGKPMNRSDNQGRGASEGRNACDPWSDEEAKADRRQVALARRTGAVTSPQCFGFSQKTDERKRENTLAQPAPQSFVLKICHHRVRCNLSPNPPNSCPRPVMALRSGRGFPRGRPEIKNVVFQMSKGESAVICVGWRARSK